MQFNLNIPKDKQSISISDTLSVDIEYAMLNPKGTLPSKANFYPIQSLYVRGLRYREQLEISQIANIQDDFIALQSAIRVYKDCIKIPSVEFDNILEDDFSILSMWVVFLTNEEQNYNMRFVCEHCQHEQTHEVSPAQMSIRDFTHDSIKTLECEFGTLLISPPTMRGMLDRYNLRSIPLSKVAKFIKALNGVELASENEKLELIRMFNKKDFDNLAQITQGFIAKIESIQLQCQKCKKDNNITPMIDLIRGIP